MRGRGREGKVWRALSINCHRFCTDVWLSSNMLVSINSYSTLGPVSAWMGDHLWTA